MDDTTHRPGLPAPPGADQPPAGTYVWDVMADQWWWSDEIYAIHGFTPGEVVPSTDVLLAHKHPDDLDKVVRVLGHAREHGGRFSCYHRVVDAQAKVRHVLVVGGATTGDDGSVRELSGFMADLTRAQRREVQPSVEQAVEGVLEHRGVIDLAKGAVMLGYGVDADQAFAVLRTSSANSNVKVHDLASRLVCEIARADPGAHDHGRIDALLARVTDPAYAPVRVTDPAGTRP